MRGSNNNVRVTPSVLDRLIDLDPRASADPSKSRSVSLAELKSAVRRDLEWLLNTRYFLDFENSDLDEAKRSIAFYGLPDITGFGGKSPQEQRRLLLAVEHALATFEPRFIDLKITLVPPTETDRQLQFKISAALDVEPAPEPISFDTVVQIGSGGFAVTEK